MTGELKRGHAHYERQEWASAFQALVLADRAAPLAAGDLELLAMSAYLIGWDDDYLRILERAHHAHLDLRERRRAVRCAFWLGFHLFLRGEIGRATGWFARAQRLLEGEDGMRGAGLPTHPGGGTADRCRRVGGCLHMRGTRCG